MTVMHHNNTIRCVGQPGARHGDRGVFVRDFVRGVKVCVGTYAVIGTVPLLSPPPQLHLGNGSGLQSTRRNTLCGNHGHIYVYVLYACSFGIDLSFCLRRIYIHDLFHQDARIRRDVCLPQDSA